MLCFSIKSEIIQNGACLIYWCKHYFAHLHTYIYSSFFTFGIRAIWLLMPKYIPKAIYISTSKTKEGSVGLNYPMLARNKYTAWV